MNPKPMKLFEYITIVLIYALPTAFMLWLMIKLAVMFS
jgi:hypothetical protein